MRSRLTTTDLDEAKERADRKIVSAETRGACRYPPASPRSSVDRAAVLEIARESVDWRACRERRDDRGKVTAVVVFACARETRTGLRSEGTSGSAEVEHPTAPTKERARASMAFTPGFINRCSIH